MIGMISIMLPRADVAAQRVDEVLPAALGTRSRRPPCARDAELAARTGGAAIAFHDVSFKYARFEGVRARARRLHGRAGQDHGHRRLHRVGQVHGLEARRALLRRDGRLGHRRRRGRARALAARAARAAGLRAAEGVPVQRHHRVERGVRGRGHAACARGGGRRHRPGRRVRVLEGGGLGVARVPGRHERVGRPAPAPRHRPRAGDRRPRLPLRRQLLGARLQDRRGPAPRAARRACPARPSSSWRSASPPCCTPTRSSCSTRGASSARARTRSLWRRARSTGRSRCRSFRRPS